MAKQLDLEEARHLFRKLDTNGDNVLSLLELGKELLDLGSSETDIENLFTCLDTNVDDKVSEDEFMSGYDQYLRSKYEARDPWRLPPELDVQVASFVEEYAHLGVDDYSDLSGGGGCEIRDTARRAISLLQLVMLAAHMVRRVTNRLEKWVVDRYEAGVKVEHWATSPYEVPDPERQP